MSNYSSLKSAIDANIKANGRREITGPVLNAILNAVVNSLGDGYLFRGVAIPSTNPGTPDQNVAYLAITEGTYTHMGGLSVTDGELSVFSYNGAWSKIPLALVPTKTSQLDNDLRFVTSEEMGESLSSKQDTIQDLSEIRSGAALGATAYQKPSAGIPSSDMTTAVQNSLELANSSVQAEPIGSIIPPVNPSEFATKEEVSQLQQEVYGSNEEITEVSYISHALLSYESSTQEVIIKYVNNGHYRVDFYPVEPGKTYKIHINNTRSEKAWGWADTYLSSSPSVDENIGGQIGADSVTSGQSFDKVITNTGNYRYIVLAYTYNTGGTTCQEIIEGDVVLYNKVQYKTEPERQMARNNIGAASAEDVLTKTAQELTDTEQVTARNNIGVDNALYGRKKNYYEDRMISEGKILYLDGVGITDFIQYTPGADIVWRFGGTGTVNIRIESYDADKNYVNYYSSGGYTDTRTIAFSDGNPAYIRASFYLQEDGVRNKKPVSIGGVDYVVHDTESGYTEFIESGVLEEERKWKPLPLGGLLNCDTDSIGHLSHNSNYDPIRVTTKSNICVPFPGITIRHRIPDGLPYILTGYWWVGKSNGNHSVLPSGGSAFVDGSVITLPETALCIRPVFRAYTTNPSNYNVPISATDIQSLIDNGKLALEYYDERNEDVLERNEATQINLQALRRVLIPGGGASNGMDSMPVFAHITDLHGDAPRWKNFLEYCDKFRVDFAIESGDAVLYQKRDASQYIYDFADEHNTDVIACIGNHESLPTGSSTLFANNLSDLATKYEYLASAGNITDKCYFFKDYDANKVRVIVINQHEDGVYARRIGQAQVDWFIATLLSTPAGYGIVIVYHAPEDKVVAESPYDVFRQPVPNTGTTFEANGAYVDKRVVELLVDAFISRTSVNFTYEDHSATYNGNSDVTTQTVSVVADFSEVDGTTEFICYVCGHRHEDWIGYYEHSTNKQLCLCITCGNALYGDSSNPAWSNQSDLPRGGVGVSQDAFCIYAIDRLNGNVKVMRVGATVTQMMVKREMMIIPYKD